jgi:hypothetical protein
MFKRVKEIAAHPYAAPVMEALKGIGGFALKPVERFVERVREGFDDDTYKYERDEKKNRPKLRRMYDRLFHTDDSAGIISFCGSVVAGLAGAVVAGAAGGTGILSMILWGAGGLAVGAATGPFLLAGAIALGAACTGLIIGGGPGLIKGCQTVIAHRKLLKAGGQIAAALPAAPPDFTEALAKALSPFNDLTPEQQNAYVKMMNQQHQDAVKGQSAQLLQALESLPDAERDALLRGLKPQLKDEFEKLAQRDANNSTVLQNEITTGGPIKLKAKKQTL